MPIYIQRHDTYKGKCISVGPFYEDFHVEISKKQKELKEKADDIINHHLIIKQYKRDGIVNIRKNLKKN